MKTAPVKLSSEIVSGWQEWAEIVGLFASRHPRRYAIDPQQYRDLHATLLRLFQERAEASNPRERELLLQLKEILEPWIYLDSLDQAEHEIVCKLADRCQTASRLLGVRGRAGRRWKQSWGRNMLLGSAAVAIAGILLSWSGDPIAGPLLATPQRWFDSVLRLIGYNTTTRLVVLGGFLATLAAIGLIWRPSR